jgi:hypothetical protein
MWDAVRHLQEPADVLAVYGCRCLYDARRTIPARRQDNMEQRRAMISATISAWRSYRVVCAAVIDAGCRRHLQERADVLAAYLVAVLIMSAVSSE